LAETGNTCKTALAFRSAKKRKKKKNKSKARKTNSIAQRLGESQPPPEQSEGNKSSTTLVVGRKLTPLEQLGGNKNHPGSRGARGKNQHREEGGARSPPPGETRLTGLFSLSITRAKKKGGELA
jgi:hypothetical protein